MTILRTSNAEEEARAKQLGLIQISRDGALENARKMVRYWSPQSEVAWLKYGGGLPVTLAAIPGLHWTTAFRRFNKIPPKIGGQLLSVLPAILIPMGTVGFVFAAAVDDILLRETLCSVCLDTKVTLATLGLGVFAPTAISITATHSYTATLSMRLPSVASREYLPWVGKMLRKSGPFMAGITLAQIAASYLVLDRCRDQWANINASVYEKMVETGEVKPRTVDS